MARDLPSAASPYRVPRSRIDDNYPTGQPLPFVQIGAAEVISLDGDRETCTVDFGDGEDPISEVIVLCDELDVEVGDWREIWQRGDVLCIPETPFTPGGAPAPVSGTIILRPTGTATLVDGTSSRTPITSGTDPAMGDESLTTYSETYADWTGTGPAQSSAITTAIDTLTIDPTWVTEIKARLVGQVSSSPETAVDDTRGSVVLTNTGWTVEHYNFTNTSDSGYEGYWYFAGFDSQEDSNHVQDSTSYAASSTTMGAVAAVLADSGTRLAILRRTGIGQATPYLNSMRVNEFEIHITYAEP